MLTSVEGECSTGVLSAFIIELEASARTKSKRMTIHNTPQLSRMDLTNNCAAFPGVSLYFVCLLGRTSLCSIGLFIVPKDEDKIFLRNVGKLLLDYMASHHIRCRFLNFINLISQGY
jgi:hypothetical protein